MTVDVRQALDGLRPELLEARRAGLDEAGTVDLVARVFGAALGYDAEKDLTRAKAVETFVDLAIQAEGQVWLLIEVVAAEAALQLGHIVEARRAAARDNVSFILLTNGLAWNLYHVTLDQALRVDTVFAANLKDGVDDETAQLLGLLHRDSVTGGGLQAYWEARARLEPGMLGKALFSGPVIEAVRKQLEQGGVRADSKVLAASIHELLSPIAQQVIGPIEAPSAAERKPS